MVGSHRIVAGLGRAVFAILLLASAGSAASRPALRPTGYVYVSPLPDARMVSPWTNIILRPVGGFDRAAIREGDLSVVGSQSGPHEGHLVTSSDGRTLIFLPAAPFATGELVRVSLEGPRTRSGGGLPPLSFTFEVASRDPRRSPRLVSDEPSGRLMPFEEWTQAGMMAEASSRPGSALAGSAAPSGIPAVSVVTSNHPEPGSVFISPFLGTAPGGSLMILDNAAQVRFYRPKPLVAFDFKMQPSGLLTYFGERGKFFGLDSSYAVVDSFFTGNGYWTDLHDLQVLPNGHALLMSYDVQPVDMSTVVPGGRPDALVIGLIVQEIDSTKNVVFEWRSWDHFEITDADTCLISLRDSIVDYVHGNTVEKDADGNLMISSRVLNEITKIDLETGDVIWRMGLHAKNNEFSFLNDPRGFTAQHDIRRLPNGNVTLFANDNCLAPLYSRAVEYQLDEVNKTATQVWEYRYIPGALVSSMGNVQRRPSGGTMIGWGDAYQDPRLTDVHADGTVGIEFGFQEPERRSYRAFRFPWQTNRFALAADSLPFAETVVAASETLSIPLMNRSSATATITETAGLAVPFTVLTPLPLTLAPDATGFAQVEFTPVVPGQFRDTLYLRSVEDGDVVAQSIVVSGSAVATGPSIEDVTDYEGHSGLRPFQLRVRLFVPRPYPISVNWRTADGTATAADTDYVPDSGRVSIPAGDTVATIVVDVVGDQKIEDDETFYVDLSQPDPPPINRVRAVGTILDDDRYAAVGDEPGRPTAFALLPTRPNPSHGTTTIRFDLPLPSHVRLDIFDLAGRRVRTLVDAELPPGQHEARWTPLSGASGVFLCRMRAGAFEAVRRLVVIQ